MSDLGHFCVGQKFGNSATKLLEMIRRKEREGEGALFRQLAILQFDCPSSLDSNRIVKIERGL